MNSIDFINVRLNLPEKSVKNTVALLAGGATIPFIARYRKEQTGSLDEVEVETISGLLQQYEELEKRKASVIKSIEEQNALTPELRTKIEQADALNVLEDLYLPYKKKRKTKADAARENGLEPLAKMIMSQNRKDVKSAAKGFLNDNIKDTEEALEGAKNIISEWIHENQAVRSRIRQLYRREAKISASVVKKEEETESAQKYRQYFDWSESLKNIPSHRFLALYRANNEGVIRLKIEVDQEKALETIVRLVLKNNGEKECRKLVAEAIEDAYKRLLKPSFSTEFMTEAKAKADEEAIRVFADNLEQLLLAPPLGEKRILAIDPGYRSGCKVVCLDENGQLLHNETIYPHPPQKETAMAVKKIKSLVNAYKIQAISIGNGTASRETEFFIKKVPFDRDISVFVVNEAGASVYSASKVAREEFPDYDVTVRGAVSIGRRLSDPLAELVKIDPKSIGVGQYQHEVDQSGLKNKLDTTVMRCVNRIGVNVNTASRELLSYVSGIGPALAENILAYRKENGALKSRSELLEVPRLGSKAFEQAAGFLRIKDGLNPLDATSVHPESYAIVENIAADNKVRVEDLLGNKELLNKVSPEKYCENDIGLPTVKDLLNELERPGADPRKTITSFQFDSTVKTIQDIRPGMKLPGLVNNITNFGCFVDIGIKESGLVHISKLAKEFVSDVHAVVKLNQQLTVTVVEVDVERKRIQLSLID